MMTDPDQANFTRLTNGRAGVGSMNVADPVGPAAVANGRRTHGGSQA